MDSPDTNKHNRKQYFSNLALAAAAGQVGCLTLIIVVGAVLIGLWLDSTFDTKPVLTLIFVIGSVPVSVIAMFITARAAARRLKMQQPKREDAGQQVQEPIENNYQRNFVIQNISLNKVLPVYF
jgi:F0F1-type ATP synthase assembly protein I